MLKIIGGVAAGLAIFQGIGLAVAWVRRSYVRNRLQGALRRFIRLDRRLTALVAEVTWKFRDGVGWTGWAIWPKPLEGHFTYMANLATELEHDIAAVRGLDADASLERLRADVEELGECLRRAYEIYTDGSIRAYQQSDGEPIPFSATGRALVAPLRDADGAELSQLRRRVRLLVRSAAYQLKEEEWAHLPAGEWAFTETELPTDTENLWAAGEPRPFS
jgi:hypothetical protein